MATYYGHWSQGTLAAQGGVIDQCATYVQAMQILDIARGEMDSRRQAQMEQSQSTSKQPPHRPKRKQKPSRK